METPKLSPAKINPTKLLPGISISTKKISTESLQEESISVLKSDLFIIKKQVFKVRDLIQTSTLIKQSELEKKRKSTEKKGAEEQENKLEAKPEKKEGKLKMPSVPKLGFLDRIKNFLFSVLLGYISIKLLPHLPKLVGIVSIIGNVMEFMIDLGGNILDKVVTFIDWGYKAIDATRGFMKSFGGENFAKGFDKFIGAIDSVLFLTTILAGSIAMEALTGGGGGPGGGVGGRPAPGTQGRPKVTTSGGGGAGRPDIRNPLRQKPKVTTGGGGKFKIPSGSSIKAGGIATLVMLIPDLISSGMLISQGRPKDGIRTFLSAVAAVGAGMAAIAGVTAGAAALGITGVGLPAAIALAIAGFAASSAASFLAYEGAEALLKKMGLVDNDPKTGKPYAYRSGGVTRGNKPVGGAVKRTISRKPVKRSIRVQVTKVKPGGSLGGKKKIEKIFPEVPTKDKGKNVNPLGYMQSSYNIATKTPSFGALFALPLKAQLGEKPSSVDYMKAAEELSGWMQNTFRGTAGYAGGGKVEAGMFGGDDMTKIVAKSLEETISSKVDAAIKELQKQLGLDSLDDKKEKTGSASPAGPGGSVSSSSEEFWILATAAMFENSDPQGAADVAQVIYNRTSYPAWNAPTITKAILNPGQFQPVSDYGGVGEWSKIKDKESAVNLSKKYGKTIQQLETVSAALLNKQKQDDARNFVGPRDSFRSVAFENANNDLADDTEVRRLGHVFGFEPRGATIGQFKAGKLSAAQVNPNVVGDVGDERGSDPSGKAGKIIAGAKKILGTAAGVVDQCANTVRRALVAGGLSEFKSKTTQKGDLDSDPNAGRNAPALAASFGGSDLGKVIHNKSNIKAGDIILWRGGGGYDSGAITHVGIAADDGLKNQYDHNTRSGFHYRPHWDSASGRNWFAGVRLMSEGGMIERPSLAIIAERGKEEFLLGGRTTELFNSLGPNLLEKINTAKTKPQLADILLSATYGGATAERQQKIDAFMNQKGMPAGKGFQGRFDMFGREYDTNTGKLKQASNKPSQDTQIAATYGEGFPKKNFMDFLEKDYQKNLKNPIKNNTNDDSRPSRAHGLPLAQQTPSSSQITAILQSYAGYEDGAEQTVIVMNNPQMIPIPIPTRNSGSIGGMSRSSSIDTTYDTQYANA